VTSLEASKRTNVYTSDARVGDPRRGVATGDLRVRRATRLGPRGNVGDGSSRQGTVHDRTRNGSSAYR